MGQDETFQIYLESKEIKGLYLFLALPVSRISNQAEF